jgi:hypothetical protein
MEVKIFATLANTSHISTANQQMFEVINIWKVHHRNQPQNLHVPHMTYYHYDGNEVSTDSKHEDALFIHETRDVASLHYRYW